MNPIEGFLMWLAGCFVGGIVVSLIMDARSEKKDQKIAKLQVDLSKAEFELNRADSVREQFERECG